MIMDREEIRTRLTAIMRETFDEDDLIADDQMSADDVADWDSSSHIMLMIAIEGDFAIHFRADEITAPENVGELIDLIERRLDART